MTLLAAYVFVHEGCDAVVLEVGMGGRLDATNALTKPAVTVVTTLDYDHVQVLGNTLVEIAREVCPVARAMMSAWGIWSLPSLLSSLFFADT